MKQETTRKMRFSFLIENKNLIFLDYNEYNLK